MPALPAPPQSRDIIIAHATPHIRFGGAVESGSKGSGSGVVWCRPGVRFKEGLQPGVRFKEVPEVPGWTGAGQVRGSRRRLRGGLVQVRCKVQGRFWRFGVDWSGQFGKFPYPFLQIKPSRIYQLPGTYLDSLPTYPDSFLDFFGTYPDSFLEPWT